MTELQHNPTLVEDKKLKGLINHFFDGLNKEITNTFTKKKLRLMDEKCYRINKSLKNVLNTTRLQCSPSTQSKQSLQVKVE